MDSSNGIMKVSIEDLQNVLASLKKQKEVINGEYNGPIKSVLESSASCLSVAGLDITTISNTFNKVFGDIDTNLDALIDVLENKVIKSYSELAEAIRKMFNDEFRTKMEELLSYATPELYAQKS